MGKSGSEGGGRVPEIIGAVFIRDEEDCDGGVGVGGVDAVGGGGVVFARVGCEGFEKGFSVRREVKVSTSWCRFLWGQIDTRKGSVHEVGVL